MNIYAAGGVSITNFFLKASLGFHLANIDATNVSWQQCGRTIGTLKFKLKMLKE